MRFALAAAVTVILGCKTSERATPSASSAGLEVIDPGAEPRRLLRYALPVHSKSTIELALDMTLTAGTMGGPTPTIVITIDTEVDAVMPTGHMNLRMTIADATAHERFDSQMPAAAAMQQIDAIKGTVILATLAPDGKLANAHVDPSGKPIPEPQVDSLVTNLEAVTMRLPDLPLGVGASWKSPRTLEPGGLKMTALTTMTLTKLEGNKVSFTSISDLRGADQTVTMSGVALRVEAIAGTGQGRGTFALDKLAIDGELKAVFKAEMSAENEKTPMQVTTTQTLTSR